MKARKEATGNPRITSPAASKRVSGYVIVTCSYTPNSAGIGCLYRLCDYLNRLGYPSFMSGGVETAPHLDAPLITADEAKRLCSAGYTAIYPETITGNPLEASSVVRWVLNRPGLLGGDEVYDESEQVFYYSNVFLPYIKNRIAGKLYMPTIDEQLFYCNDDGDLSRRNLECFYVGKSTWRDGVIDRNQAFEITRETPAKKELGKLFRAARVLYCFDNSTILIYEALLCGCPVVIIPDGTQTKEDYENLELGIDGISWGITEAQGRPVNVTRLKERYAQVKRDFETQLSAMIDLTQRRVASYAPGSQRVVRSQRTQPWGTRLLDSCKLTIASARAAGRTVERSVRRTRKKWMQRWFGKRTGKATPWEDVGHFFCDDGDTSKRSLECFYPGRTPWVGDLVNREVAFEISPETPGAQLGKLLRASHTLYVAEGEELLIERARRCGCRVEVLRHDRAAARRAA